MAEYKLFESEYRFMEVVWAHAPVNSTTLVTLCRKQLGWKKSTTYTVLRKLSERGITKNENAVVTWLVDRDAIRIQEGRNLLDRSFEGSLPAFLATFLRSEKLSREEAEELKQIIDQSVVDRCAGDGEN